MDALNSVLVCILFSFVQTCKCIERAFLSFFPSIVKNQIIKNFRSFGITIGGSRQIDIRVMDDRFYLGLASDPLLSLGESYINGWYECDDLEGFIRQLFQHGISKHLLPRHHRLYNYLMLDVANLQAKSRARDVAVGHYDLGNELFLVTCGVTLNYSCAYWKNAENLDQAQIKKMNLIARKLKLKPGMRVLDIGCGWGSLCKYLAKNYSVEVTGYNVSKEQIKYARQLCEGLNVVITDADYRDMNGRFDRIVSVEMFEHEGDKNHRTFFQIVHRCLADDGIFLLHTAGVNHVDQFLNDPFTQKYLFPNLKLAYYKHITEHSEGLFVIEDWHNFGYDYSQTLRAWYNNFVQGWPKIADQYDEKFYRLWTFYLRGGAAVFDTRKVQLWQIAFSKNGLKCGYLSER